MLWKFRDLVLSPVIKTDDANLVKMAAEDPKRSCSKW